MHYLESIPDCGTPDGDPREIDGFLRSVSFSQGGSAAKLFTAIPKCVILHHNGGLLHQNTPIGG
jgi:hypothetical protein